METTAVEVRVEAEVKQMIQVFPTAQQMMEDRLEKEVKNQLATEYRHKHDYRGTMGYMEWNPNEDLVVMQEGKTIAEKAKELGRSYKSITGRYYKLVELKRLAELKAEARARYMTRKAA